MKIVTIIDFMEILRVSCGFWINLIYLSDDVEFGWRRTKLLRTPVAYSRHFASRHHRKGYAKLLKARESWANL